MNDEDIYVLRIFTDICMYTDTVKLDLLMFSITKVGQFN